LLFLIGMVAGIVFGLVVGGRLSNLARLRFRWPWLILAAAVLRLAVVLPPLNRIEASRFVYAAALAAIVVWTLWHVSRLPGVWLVSAGGALNLLVILANGVRMPVAPEFAASLARHGQIGQYTVIGPGTNLNALADWIRLYPSPEVYSVGDILIALGLAVVLFVSTATPPRIVV
jgi:Family of unknown function (DUF5317)